MQFVTDNLFFIIFLPILLYRIINGVIKKESVFPTPTMKEKFAYLIAGFAGFLFGLFILKDMRYTMLFITFTLAATYDITTNR